MRFCMVHVFCCFPLLAGLVLACIFMLYANIQIADAHDADAFAPLPASPSHDFKHLHIRMLLSLVQRHDTCE